MPCHIPIGRNGTGCVCCYRPFTVRMVFILRCSAEILTPPGRSPLFLRSWVKGQNPARLYKIWFLHSPDVFLYLRQYGFCPDSWPRFRGRHCGTNALRWFCLRQKPKNPPLIPRRGPLWKPRGSAGVARDGLRFSQGKGSLLQYRFFPAGKAHPGSRSETPPAFAGGPVCGKRLPCPFTCRPRRVCRGRMHAARGRSPYGNVFGSCTRLVYA